VDAVLLTHRALPEMLMVSNARRPLTYLVSSLTELGLFNGLILADITMLETITLALITRFLEEPRLLLNNLLPSMDLTSRILILANVCFIAPMPFTFALLNPALMEHSLLELTRE